MGGIEKKFVSKDEVEAMMKGNQEVLRIINSTEQGNLLWILLPEAVANAVNAKRVSDDDPSTFTTLDGMINASNQNYWAYSAISPRIANPYLKEFTANISRILFGTEVIELSEENAHAFMSTSLDLSGRAYAHPDFEPELVKHILSSYIKRGRRTGEEYVQGDCLVIKVLEEMYAQKDLEATLDFFDEHIADNYFMHPFREGGFTFDEPFIVTTRFLSYLGKEVGTNAFDIDSSDQPNAIRLSRTIANYYLHARQEMQPILYQLHGMNERVIRDQIRHQCTLLHLLTGKEGKELADFLRENGFEEGVVEFYYTWVLDEPYRTSQQRTTMFPHTDQLPREVKEALEVLGYKQPPDDKEVVKRTFRREVLKYHPDRSDLPDATKKTAQLTGAWKIVEDHYRGLGQN